MKLTHITLSVKDLEKSIQFYRDIIGLPVRRRFVSGESEIVFLGDGDTMIELVYNNNNEDVAFGMSVSLGFQVEALSDAIVFLAKNGVAVGDVIQPNPNVKFAFAKDPDGLRVQFVEQTEY